MVPIDLLGTSARPIACSDFDDLVDHVLDRLTADRPLGRSHLDAGQQLLAVERFAAAITLDHEQVSGHMLIGRKALTTLLTLAAPANGVAGITCVNHTMRMYIHNEGNS